MIDLNKAKMAKIKKRKKMTYTLEADTLEKFNQFAEANELNKSIVVEMLIQALLKEYNVIKD